MIMESYTFFKKLQVFELVKFMLASSRIEGQSTQFFQLIDFVRVMHTCIGTGCEL